MTAADADLAIVGGGVIGCMLAVMYLRAVPGAGVMIVDRGLLGGGVSGASLSSGIPAARTDLLRALVARSDELFARLAGLRAHVMRYPALYCVGRGRIAQFQSWLSVPPFSQASDQLWKGAASTYGELRRDSDAVVLDGRRHAFTFDTAAFVRDQVRTAGSALRVIEHQNVDVIRRDGGQWILESAGQAVGRAGKVALCVGAAPPPPVSDVAGTTWPPRAGVKRIASLRVPLTTTAVAAPSVVWIDHAVSIVPSAGAGHCFINFQRSRFLEAAAPLAAGFDNGDLAAGLTAATRVWPGLPFGGIGGMAAYDSCEIDGVPRVTEPARGLIAITGASGAGVRLSPALAERAVRSLNDST